MKKNYEGAESGERKKNKKVIFSSKKEFVRGHSFMMSTKKDQISGEALYSSIHKHPILV